jgi:hypothetical protein
MHRAELIPLLLLGLVISWRDVGLGAQSGPAVLVGAADIARCTRTEHELTAKLVDRIEGTVFTAGDHAYPYGRPQDFLNCYDPSWGRHRRRTRPAPGNHDYDFADGAAYFDYFGANAGPRGLGYYSYDLGAWHVVALNSNANASSWGAAQERWLVDDLRTHPAVCTLAYWHHPRFSSGERYGDQLHVATLFRIIYDHGVDVLVAGHDHIYERFAPQNPEGKADPSGVREFIAGTGGGRRYNIGSIKPNSEARSNTTAGVLKFTLYPTSYDWEFIPVAGRRLLVLSRFTDKGNAACSTRSAAK